MHIGAITFYQIAALLMVLSWSAHAEATIFWEDGFEQTLTSSGWDTSTCGNGTAITPPGDFNAASWPNGCNSYRSQERAHSGSWSMKGDFTAPNAYGGNNTTGTWGTFYDKYHPASRDIWMRYYEYTTDWTPPSGNATTGGKVFYNRSSQTANHEAVWVKNWNQDYNDGSMNMTSTFDYEFCLPSGSVHFDSCPYYQVYSPQPATNPNFRSNQWYCIETHVKMNDPGQANGIVEIFVNGVQALNYQNRTFVSSNESPYPGYDFVRFYTQIGHGIRYIDDLAVGDTRIGCSAGSNTAPAAPTGLTVR